MFGPARYLFVFVDVDGPSSQGKTVTNKQVTYSVLNRGASLGSEKRICALVINLR